MSRYHEDPNDRKEKNGNVRTSTQLVYSVFACITAQGTALADTLAFSRSLIFLDTRVLPSRSHEFVKLESGIGCSCGHLPHAYLKKRQESNNKSLIVSTDCVYTRVQIKTGKR